MALNEKVLDFIGSKWFVFLLMVVMTLALPVTYGNVKVIYDAGEISSYWYLAAVFACNIIGIIFAFFKFMTLMSNKEEKKNNQNQEWEQ